MTPSVGSTQFRLRTATHQDVNQITPIVYCDAVNVTGGANPSPYAVTTEDQGLALAFVAANQGTSDGLPDENVSYSNMAELFEDQASQTYGSIGTADTGGSSFTPSLTLTHGQVGHVLGVSLEPV